MVTLIARLCALCAVSALMQMAVPEDARRGSLRMICGLLMLHMTISGASELCARLAGEPDLMRIFETLMK